ncbi:MAG: hypothetical protein JNJ40_14045 [Bacteroidia bacterium]|nr:hypothetical protein [Bacteroidia bacterium]
MKKFTIILASLLLSKIATAQDSLRHYEFGSTLFTLNSISPNGNFAANKASTEFINGLFFRTTYKRVGFRAQVSYSDHSRYYLSNKDFRIGVGAQYNLLKKKDWLYTYADVLYRNVQTKGDYVAFNVASYNRSSNGLDGFLGLGFKLKATKNFYISPEMGFNVSYDRINFNSTTPTNVYKGALNHFNFNPVLKLQLTLKFK